MPLRQNVCLHVCVCVCVCVCVFVCVWACVTENLFFVFYLGYYIVLVLI